MTHNKWSPVYIIQNAIIITIQCQNCYNISNFRRIYLILFKNKYNWLNENVLIFNIVFIISFCSFLCKLHINALKTKMYKSKCINDVIIADTSNMYQEKYDNYRKGLSLASNVKKKTSTCWKIEQLLNYGLEKSARFYLILKQISQRNTFMTTT